jgi:hypothetical protein
MAPKLPPNVQQGVFEVVVEEGCAPDLSNPEDRLLAALLDPNPREIDGNDLADAGDSVIAHLAHSYRDEGVAGVTGQLAGKCLNALNLVPDEIVNLILRALDKGKIRHEEVEFLSLALLPLVLVNEDKFDLQLDDELRNRVWSVAPILAAAIEPWTDGLEALAQWSDHIGWPRRFDWDDDSEDLEQPQAPKFDVLNDLPPIGPFAATVNLLVGVPGQSSAIDDISGSLDQIVTAPLTVDGRFVSIIQFLASWRADSTSFENWRTIEAERIRSARAELEGTRYGEIAHAYCIPNPPDNALGCWYFSDIASLAFAAVTNRGDAPEYSLSLLRAWDAAPKWITHSVLRALREVASENHERSETTNA